MNTITPGTLARVRMLPDCRVEVTVTDRHTNGDHHVFALCKGGGGSYRGPSRPGGLGIGRYFHPDELEPCDPPW
jgi:hypothetical protein